MLQTVKAEIDVNGNVRLLEPITIGKPTRALVTLLDETVEQTPEQADTPPRGNAAAVLEFLRTHRLPEARRSSAEEMEAQIQENRNSWD